MILMLVPPLVLLLALALGGRPEALLTLPVRRLGLALLALAVQWLLVRVPGTEPASWFGGVLVGTHAMLVAWLWANRRLPALRLALAGALLNLVVIAANGGFMPVTPGALATAHLERPGLALGRRLPLSKDILLAPEQARLAPLGDSLVLPGPVPEIFSPGDLLLAAGLAGLVLRGTRPQGRRAQRIPQPAST